MDTPQSSWYAHWFPAQVVATYADPSVQSGLGVKTVVSGMAEACVKVAWSPVLVISAGVVMVGGT